MVIAILVQHGGWQIVARYDPGSGHALVRADLKAVIRYWGTDSGELRGLGELARSGPKPGTILDWEPGGDVNLALTTRVIECRAEAWREAFEQGERIDDGDGNGGGFGAGNGNGAGSGNGFGNGAGYGNGDGDAVGGGVGAGGNGNVGNGSGSGAGNGDGDGSGSGGNGSGGNGNGAGKGDL